MNVHTCDLDSLSMVSGCNPCCYVWLSIMSSYNIDYGHFSITRRVDGESVKTDNGPRQYKISHTEVGLKQIHSDLC